MKRARFGAALLCALPWGVAAPLVPAWVRGVVALTFAPLCHHLADRVLTLATGPMCVCSRCAGLYAGLATGFLAPAPLAGGTYRKLLTVALLFACVDVVTQDLGWHAPNHVTRLATGAALGWVASAWMARSQGSRVAGC